MPGHTGPGRVLLIFFMKDFCWRLDQCLHCHHHPKSWRFLNPAPGPGNCYNALDHEPWSHCWYLQALGTGRSCLAGLSKLYQGACRQCNSGSCFYQMPLSGQMAPEAPGLLIWGVLASVCLLTQALTYSSLVSNVSNILGFRSKVKHSAELWTSHLGQVIHGKVQAHSRTLAWRSDPF